MTIDQEQAERLDPILPGSTPMQTSADRRRTWAIRIALLTSVALVIAVIGALVWARNYQPMDSGFLGGVRASDARVVSVSNTFGDEYQVIRPEPSSTIRAYFGILLSDDAPSPVTLESVGSPLFTTDSHMVGYVSKVSVSSRDEQSRPDQDLAKGPIVLQPGTALDVTIVMTIADCPAQQRSDGRSIFTDVPVTYTAFGSTHHIRLPLGYAISLAQAPQCPARG